MYLITLYAIALGFASTQIFALPCTDTPASPLSNETFGLWVRDVPQRPEGVHPATFHASVFEQFDQNSKKISGMFDINHPAAIHAPVFLYARINPSTVSRDYLHTKGVTLIVYHHRILVTLIAMAESMEQGQMQ